MVLTHQGLVMPYGDRCNCTLAQVMAYCLTAPSHYMKQCRFLINKVPWYSTENNYAKSAQATIPYNEMENYACKITAKSPRRQ